MPGLLQRFLPRDDDYFKLFRRQAENIQKGAKALCDMLSRYTAVPEQVKSIKAIEHAGDEIAHTIIMKLNQTFITPIDREDIHELCSTLDDVIDLIDAAASRFVLYRVNAVRIGTAGLAKVLLEACTEVTALIQSGTRLFVESKFSDMGVRLAYSLELNNNQVIKTLVEANL